MFTTLNNNNYYIRTFVFLYKCIDLNWSIFFDIGCVKIHVKWYRVWKQNRTTFVLLLFAMMTLRTKDPIIPAFSWRHNVFMTLNFNLASILTLFYTINLYISSNILLEVFHVDHFVQNHFLNINYADENLQVLWNLWMKFLWIHILFTC